MDHILSGSDGVPGGGHPLGGQTEGREWPPPGSGLPREWPPPGSGLPREWPPPRSGLHGASLFAFSGQHWWSILDLNLIPSMAPIQNCKILY